MTTKITPAAHLAEVQASFDESMNPRLVEILRSAVRHLHAFVEETGMTREEWKAGIDFLTKTGQKCDDVRQEFILLSDTLGVSMLVEMINQRPSDNATDPTVFGPFYVPGAPEKVMGDSIASPGGGGEPLVIRGAVRNASGAPLGRARLDVWQVAPNGLYDVQDPDMAPMSYRGVFTTGADGRFEIHTSRPVDYQIPTDGPVGQLLQATGRHSWRPAHTHFMVTCPGYKTLITHVFDRASPNLASDAVFGVRDSLIIDMDNGSASIDFVLDTEQ